MTELVFHPQAQAELDEAAMFYEQRVPGLGLAFAGEVQKSVSLILAHPEIGGSNSQGFRCLAIRRFPFSVTYRTNDSGVYIIAVAHQHRRPGYWKKRAG